MRGQLTWCHSFACLVIHELPITRTSVFLIGVCSSNAIGINAVPISRVSLSGECDYPNIFFPKGKCAISCDYSRLLQVRHRQDPAGFECTCSLDNPHLASDGLTVVIVPFSSSAKCYSWNRDTAQFDPVQFDDQAHIRFYSLPEYSPDGKLLECWSRDHFHI